MPVDRPLHPAAPLLAACLGLLLSGCGDDSLGGTASETGTTSEGASSTAGGPTSTSSETSGGSGSESGTTTTTTATSDASTTGAPLCEGAPQVQERGLLKSDEPAPPQTIDPCGGDRWYFVAASESTLEITLTGTTPEGLGGLVAYPDLSPAEALLEPLDDTLMSAAGEPMTLTFGVPRSGEFALDLLPTIAEAGATYELEVRCVSGCERETTRFPVLWVHGWTGFENIGPLTYFFGIRDHLEPLGFPMSVAVLDPYNSSEIRGAQLGEQIDEALAEWRARKLDLLGHSQGGIDSRYAISSLGHGEHVSALLTVATPHRGTYIMDLALGLAPGGVEEALAFLLNLLGAVSADAQSDAKASFYSLSETYMEGEFNPASPDHPDVAYISYTGRTCAAIDFLDPKKMCDDYVDPLILVGYNILKIARGPNDGLVTVESAKWGDYRGEMNADHIDEVGQIAGITDPDFDHRAWYLARVRELALEGH